MSFKPNIETRQQKSQATPFAEDFLAQLQGQLDSGTMGMGMNPMTQRAGTAIEQFMTALSGKQGIAAPGAIDPGGAQLPAAQVMAPAGANFGDMIKSIEAVQNRRVGEQAGNLREQAGAAGTRYGSTLAQGEGTLRSNAEADFGVTMSQLAQQLDEARRADTGLMINQDLSRAQISNQANQFQNQSLVQQGQFGHSSAVQQEQNQQQTMLQAIAQMFGQGQANMAPFLQALGLGVMPDNQFVSPGAGSQIFSGVSQFLSNFGPSMVDWLKKGGSQNPTGSSGTIGGTGPGSLPTYGGVGQPRFG